MARPTKTESEKLTERVAFRVTLATKNEYELRLAQSGLSKSDFFRECVMTDRTEIIVPATVTVDMRESLRLLSNIANNCNQIAHALNIANQAGLISDALVETVLSKVSALLETAKSQRK
ncbi:TPA: MobC family plasmid mobilization relaxosome protein [Enterobacter cloacae]|uniref:plasmid mobilization protein n=1 Tax=Enterobacter hormaechei TaxID=158836 RepID=UPI00190B4109|nr:plasmid mobilization relaxosome protein MobC [Enterobacter hormaechei]HAV2128642.1 MobC family plasmid mobilization relaxosome protein [Enterobacter cloacae]HBR4538435.1 plasmid mobilization relaxosome protein MobC [Klebsiella pneumoniae]MBK4367009.1 plasmid mobilization relaxosome protein MobC [Enterobacter hormaechei]MBK4597784.1 plasmid mobilization relaxosome protein MobC [Enterobacter hormaechei]WLZ47496.1 plasmid mobilization relaxosome protein MobC [Enterobacter hormaechei]